MKKLYVSLIDADMNLNFVGVGDIHIPARGVVELEHYVAIAVMELTPVQVLEECTDVTEEMEGNTPAFDMPELGDDHIGEEPVPLEELTNKELQALCDAKAIIYGPRDTKAELIAHLTKEE